MANASFQRPLTSLRLALCLGAAVSLAACVSPPNLVGPPPIDATSPVAQDVIAASQVKGPFPHFRDIPAVPKDVRPVTAWRTSVLAMISQRDALASTIAATPFEIADPDLWAKNVRSQSGLETVGPAPSPASNSETEAFAKALRDRATPPPPPK